MISSDSTAASSPPVCSVEAPDGSEPLAVPDDCSAELQADDRFAAVAARTDDSPEQVDSVAAGCLERVDSAGADYLAPAGSAPDGCWVAASDDSAADYSEQADSPEQALAGCRSELAGCSEPVDLAPDGYSVAASDDHCAPAVLPDDSPEQVDSAAAGSVVVGSAAHSQRASRQADLPADWRVLAAVSRAWTAQRHSRAMVQPAESSSPVAAVLPAGRDAGPALAASPQTTAVAAGARFSQIPGDLQWLLVVPLHAQQCLRVAPLQPAVPER
jgi:hypothetical protein